MGWIRNTGCKDTNSQWMKPEGNFCGGVLSHGSAWGAPGGEGRSCCVGDHLLSRLNALRRLMATSDTHSERRHGELPLVI